MSLTCCTVLNFITLRQRNLESTRTQNMHACWQSDTTTIYWLLFKTSTQYLHSQPYYSHIYNRRFSNRANNTQPKTLAKQRPKAQRNLIFDRRIEMHEIKTCNRVAATRSLNSGVWPRTPWSWTQISWLENFTINYGNGLFLIGELRCTRSKLAIE